MKQNRSIRRIKLSILALLCSQIVIFPVPTKAQSEPEVLARQRMVDRMERLERDMTLFQKEYFQQQDRKRENSGYRDQGDVAVGGSLEAHMLELEERLRQIMGKIEENEHQIDNLAKRLDGIITDIDYRLNNLEKTTDHSDIVKFSKDQKTSGAATTGTEASADTVAEERNEEEGKQYPFPPLEKGNKMDAKQAYEKAFGLLRQANYQEAEKNFYDFIQQYPESDLLNNAYYWLGETHFVQNNFEQGSIYFLKSYQKFPTSDKAPDSLLKLGMSLANLKKKQEACATFVKLGKEFPKMSPYISQKMVAEKKRLGC